MKYMTKKNIEKVTNMIMEKGYDHITAENMAINCFCIAQQFGESVEDCVRTIESTYKPMVVTQQKNRSFSKMEVAMARENLFKQMEVTKGNHWCMFCDSEADFVITNSMVSPKTEYPMCKKCAELFKGKINIGLEMK